MTRQGLTLAGASLALAACAAPTLDLQLNQSDAPRAHAIFRVDWRAAVTSPTETVQPFEVEQSRWEPLEISTPAVAQIKGCEGCAPTVVVGGSDGSLSAFTTLGHALWTFRGSGVLASPTVQDGVAYVGSSDGKVYAVSVGDGSALWTYVGSEPMGSPPILKDGTVYIQSFGNVLLALEAATGKSKWSYKRDVSSREFTVRGVRTPAFAQNLIVAGFADGATVALRQTDGTLVWQHVASSSAPLNDVTGSPQTDGKRVFVANFRGGIAALAVEDGRVLWQKAFGAGSQLRLGKDRLFATGVGKFAAFSTTDGTRLWQRTSEKLTGTAITLFPGVVIFSTDGPLLFLDARTGHELGRSFNPGRGTASAPSVVGREMYVLSNNGWLYGMHLF